MSSTPCDQIDKKLLSKFCKFVNAAQMVEVNGTAVSFYRLEACDGEPEESIFYADWKTEDNGEFDVDIPLMSFHPLNSPKYNKNTGMFQVKDSEGEFVNIQMFTITPITK